MRSLWLALVFLLGGISHEIRNPVSCLCIASRQATGPGKRVRK
jgi:hypothetical protein